MPISWIQPNCVKIWYPDSDFAAYLCRMKIYTKKGDGGETSLIGGTRVPKHHIRVEAYGTADELNVCIGLIADQLIANSDRMLLRSIQDRLFTLGAALASDPERSKMAIPDLVEEDVHKLEIAIDQMQSFLPPLQNFILPGGHTTVSYCHLARVVCRRTERIVTHLAEIESVEPIILIYLNRLSDFLFVLSRKIAFDLQVPEVPWRPRG